MYQGHPSAEHVELAPMHLALVSYCVIHVVQARPTLALELPLALCAVLEPIVCAHLVLICHFQGVLYAACAHQVHTAPAMQQSAAHCAVWENTLAALELHSVLIAWLEHMLLLPLCFVLNTAVDQMKIRCAIFIAHGILIIITLIMQLMTTGIQFSQVAVLKSRGYVWIWNVFVLYKQVCCGQTQMLWIGHQRFGLETIQIHIMGLVIHNVLLPFSLCLGLMVQRIKLSAIPWGGMFLSRDEMKLE